jgi:hypothetical protein
LPTLGWELPSVSNAFDTGPSGTSRTERLHFLLTNAHIRPLSRSSYFEKRTLKVGARLSERLCRNAVLLTRLYYLQELLNHVIKSHGR